MTPDGSAPTSSSAPRRKNGRQQACEPCRRRKVACDHRLPVCSRCRRGNIPEKCVFLVPARSASVASPPPPSPARSPIKNRVKADSATPRSDGNTGYLGATSFSAFYEETQKRASSPGRHDSYAEIGCPRARADSRQAVYNERALQTLRSIPEMTFAYALVTVKSSVFLGWSQLAGERLHQSLWSTFKSCLGHDSSDEALARMAAVLCNNTDKPFDENQTDAEQWIQSFSGPNMRWESLGHLFIYWAYGVPYVPEAYVNKLCDSLSLSGPRELVIFYQNCASRCIELSRESTGNTVLLFLVFKHCRLESTITGDTGIRFWRLHGELLALTTYLGLHESSNTNVLDMAISVQMKRRLFAALFAHDKGAATFTGRPTFLNRRFVSTPLPLDISDQVLFGGAAAVKEGQISFDEDGWNKNGLENCCTFSRANTMLSTLRDEILEIALQNYDGDRTVLEDLKRRALEFYERLPRVVTYHPDDLSNRDIEPGMLRNRLLLKLEHFQNLFLLERLLCKYCKFEASLRLFEISMQMVSDALLFWTNQQRLNGSETCLDWLVVCFAAPAGGILCMELLRCNTSQPVLSASTKATIVEKLSLLVAFLDWVSPSASNYEICRRVMKAVRNVIEQAMEPAPVRVSRSDETAWAWNQELSADVNAFFNFDLLDTFDWMRPDAGTFGS